MPESSPLFANIAAMQARFEERDLVQLTDAAGAGSIDADRISRALVKADAIITGYVASRHADAASFAGHDLLADVACDIAFADLWRTEQPEHVKTRRKDAIDTLKDIAAGRIKLDGGQEEAAPRPGQIITSGPDRKFDRDSLAGF